MECRWSVDVLKQPKKKQQGKSLPLTLWWLISLQNDPLFLCSIQISKWVRVRMKMKQDRRDPLITHCGGSDGRCLVTKRTWCFCEFAGALGSPTEPCKLLGNTWFESVRRAVYQFLRSAPGVHFVESVLQAYEVRWHCQRAELDQAFQTKTSPSPAQ